MEKDLSLFEYTFIDHQLSKTLFMFHGTGGTKEDFLFLDDVVGQNYNLVGMQGNVVEEGSRRFFKRIDIGVFDQKSIQTEVEKLMKFMTAWINEHNTSIDQIAYIGYSNGANVLLAAMFLFPETFKNLVLLHGRLPFEVNEKQTDLSQHNIFLSGGKGDFYVPDENQKELVAELSRLKAKLVFKEYEFGHHVGKDEMVDAVNFLNEMQ